VAYGCVAYNLNYGVDKKPLTINQAVSLRVRELLAECKISQYRLEQDSGISHSQMGFILKNRNNSLNFKTIVMLAKGFGMTIVQFLDSKHFAIENLDVE